MNFKEALIALANGKKVRRLDWDKGVYIYMNGMNVEKSPGVYYYLGVRFDSDSEWEIYEEYDMNFAEALAWMCESSLNICKSSNFLFYRVINNNFEHSDLDIDSLSHEWTRAVTPAGDLLNLKFRKVEK